MLLRPSVKNYPWGKIGSNSLVSQLVAVCGGENVVEDKPYAELWMGAHPSGSGTFVTNPDLEAVDGTQPVSLNDYISANPYVLGQNITANFGSTLPFLLKVLSVGKALSIQAHPDKNLATILHAKDPANYPDSNHKPEMAVAITPFEVLCGFRGFDEINAFIKDIPELREITGDILLKTKEDLRQAYKQLMTCNNDLVRSKIKQLLERSKSINVPEMELILRLNKEFPYDIGIFNAYFLQHFTLQPGEALFLPANEPHAYLSGDCVECMASSDNVVRAGLTPKFKDVNVLVDMLTFEAGKDWLFPGIESGGGKTFFCPPVPDFAVESIRTSEKFTLSSYDSCSVVLVLEGSASVGSLKLSKGSVAFLPADFCETVVPDECMIQLFRAFCPKS